MKPKIILAGGSGLLGRSLAAHFQAKGFEVVVLTRSPKPANGPGRQVGWDARTLRSRGASISFAHALGTMNGKGANQVAPALGVRAACRRSRWLEQATKAGASSSGPRPRETEAGSWKDELEGALAVINLAGKSVNCRYQARNRREILNSRTDSTRVIH